MSTAQGTAGRYHQYKGKIKERFGEIADDEFERASGSLEQMVGLLQKKTGEARKNIEQFLGGLMGNASDTAGAVASQVRQYASQAEDTVRDGYNRLASGVQEGYEQARTTVSNRPVESLAVALGAGLLVGTVLGLLISTRSR